MVDIQVIFTAGSAYDNQQWGLASLTASLLDEGTKQHSADQIAQAFDKQVRNSIRTSTVMSL